MEHHEILLIPLILILISWLPPISVLAASPYPGKVSLGAYKVPLTSPIFYESFVPLIYEYNVPVYKALDITLRDWRAKCENDNFAPSYTCPVFYHFERFLERFEQEVVPQAWIDPPGSTSTLKHQPSVLREVDDFCNKIQPHFKGSLTQRFGFEAYVDQLRLCPVGELRIKRAIDDYAYSIKALFKKMNDNYEAEFSNKFFTEVNKKIGPAFYVNAVSSHQNGLLMAYWVEKTRWSQAQLSCNEQKIPEFLLKVSNITESVGDLNGKLHMVNQMTSVPLEEISSYYKLPLTDCTYIETTGKFVVRVFIPIRRKESNLKMFRVQPVSFIHEGMKEGEEKYLCKMKPIPGRFLYDDVTGSVLRTECDDKEQLCLFNYQKDVSLDLCVRSIFANSTQGVRKHCQFDCTLLSETFNTLPLPMVQRVSSDTWVITGYSSSPDKLSIKCEGQSDIQLEDSTNSNGALEVKLPCECRLKFKSEVFFVQSPCQAGVDLNPTISTLSPVHFYKEETLKTLGKGNFSMPISDNFLAPESAQRLKGSAETTERAAVATKIVSKESEGTSLGALWALVILQLIAISALLALFIYRYVKDKREIAYSKERLVYNVYASPSNPSLNEIGRGDNMNHL